MPVYRRFISVPAIRALRSLVAIGFSVFVLLLAGALLETSTRAIAAQGAYRNVLLLRPLAGADSLLTRAERQPEVAGAAGYLSAQYSDRALAEAGWRQASIRAVRTDLAGWRFAPPSPGLRLAAGGYPEQSDQVLLGYELARALRAQVGDTVWVRERPFTVAGMWQPAGLARGDFLQLSYEAFTRLFAAGRYAPDPIYLVLTADVEPAAAATQLQRYLPAGVVQTPDAVWAKERRLQRFLVLVAAALALLVTLVCGPAAANAIRPLPRRRIRAAVQAAGVGLAGGVGGLALTWAVAHLLNDYAARTYAITPLAISTRLALLALLWPAFCGVLAGAMGRRTRAGRVRRLWRASRAAGVVTLAAMLSILAGSLQESLALALQRTDAGNAGRLSLEPAGGQPLTTDLYNRLAQLPGLRGLIVEVDGGALSTAETGWPGAPPSGTLYGLASGSGCTGVAVPYPVCLAEGRSLRGADEAIVGDEFARRRGLRVGDTFAIDSRAFVVAGIRERWPYPALNPVNDRVDITLETLRRLRPAQSAGRVTLLVPPVREEAKRDTYLELIRQTVRGVSVTSAREELVPRVASCFAGGRPLAGQDPVAHLRGLYGRLWLAAVLLAAALASLAVDDALYPSYLEQERELALQRLLGVPADDILGNYLAEALVIVTVGVLIGGCAAALWVRALNAAFYGSPSWMPLVVTPRLPASLAVTAVGAALLSAAGAAFRAAAVDPAQALAPQAQC